MNEQTARTIDQGLPRGDEILDVPAFDADHFPSGAPGTPPSGTGTPPKPLTPPTPKLDLSQIKNLPPEDDLDAPREEDASSASGIE